MALTEWEQYKHDQAEAWLLRVPQLRQRMAAAEAAVDELRELADGLHGLDYTREMVQHSTNADAIPNAVARIFYAISDWCRKIGEYVDEVTTVRIAVNDLENPKHQLILKHIYFDGWSLEDLHTDQALRYSRQYLRRLRSAALVAFFDKLEEMGKVEMPSAF